MHICFIITRGDDVGGAQIHVRDLCRRLLSQGCRVEVILGGRGVFTQLLELENIPVLVCPHLSRKINPKSDWTAYLELRNAVASRRPDLLSLHSSKTGILGRLVAHSLSIPCVFTAHGWAFTEGVDFLKRSVYRIIEQYMARYATRIICVSQYDYVLAVNAGIPKHKITQIYNGISVTPQNAMPSVAKTNKPVPRAVMIARFGGQKDHLTLLRAMKLVPKMQLDLVGDGPKLGEVQTAADRLGLTNRIRYLGYRTDVVETLQAADVFCLISNYEGFPYTTLEAMREGLPTVVSNVGGAGEAVVDGKTGFLIEKGNIDVLARRLEFLTTSAAARVCMGSAARKRLLSNFTVNQMLAETMQVYKSALLEYNTGSIASA